MEGCKAAYNFGIGINYEENNKFINISSEDMNSEKH
jgi:hypothetical protein